MASSSSLTPNYGGGFCILLALVFTIQKVMGAISWPWLWVLSPLWVPLAMIAVGAFIGAIFIALTRGKTNG